QRRAGRLRPDPDPPVGVLRDHRVDQVIAAGELRNLSRRPETAEVNGRGTLARQALADPRPDDIRLLAGCDRHLATTDLRFGPDRTLARHPETVGLRVAVLSALDDHVAALQRGCLSVRLFDRERVGVEAAGDGLAARVLQGPAEFGAGQKAAVVNQRARL